MDGRFMELALTPSGRIVLRSTADSPAAETEGQFGRATKAFANGQAEGLFSLATERFEGPLPPAFSFWRDFAVAYLTALCHTPEVAGLELEPIPPPVSGELATLILRVPPMQGAEYLSEAILIQVWTDLDAWVRNAIAADGEGLSGFLKQRAPLWHQVGRVCFHLGENRRSEDCPFAFLATYAPSVVSGSRIRYQPLSMALRELAGAQNKNALVRLLSPVQAASQQSALVKELVESGDIYQTLAWTPHEAYRFLKDAPILEESGILVRLPDWWKKRPRPRVGVTIGDARQKSFDAESMLDFKVQLALGDEQLSEKEWRELMAADDGLVMLRGQWVEVDRQKLREALDHWKHVEEQAHEGISFLEGMRLLAGVPADLTEAPVGQEDRQWSFVHAGQWLGDVLAKMRSPECLQPAESGEVLQATLRPYQATGVNWLRFLSGLGLGACLADDMGLGKTIQILALFLALKGQKSDALVVPPGHHVPMVGGKSPKVPPKGGTTSASLLVLPASLLGNWKAEMTRFAPTLRAAFIHPAETPKDDLDRIAADPDRALRNLDVVVTSYGMLLRQEWLMKIPWRLAVLDEAQAIKNPAARQTKAVKRLRADARIALTGTPVENRLSDLWSLFDFICPGLLGTPAKFKEFTKSLGDRSEDRYAPLRRLVQPYILRRLKTDRRIIDDLPEKVEVCAFCGLSKRQAATYAKLVHELSETLKNVEGMKRRGLVLAYLMRFKQLCNHPSQLLGDGRYAAEDSGKFARLAEICEEIASRQERALVFTQFREMTEPLAGFLTTVFGRAGLVLHGGTAVKRRKDIVDQFQGDDGPPFLVLSLKAGGTGLNLTAASHVIHFDRWWNPAVESQATDRAFRIGQRRNVLVHKFVCRGTIEERIDAMIDEKRQLAADLLEGGAEKLLTEMSDAELIRFVSLDVERASA
jgi:non-specific serine/threonine protein kinase